MATMDGLVAHWDPEKASSSYQDLSGGIDLVNQGMSVITDTTDCFEADAASAEYATTSLQVDNWKELTFAAWVNRASNYHTGVADGLFGAWTSSNGIQIHFQADGELGCVIRQGGTVDNTGANGTQMSDGTWYHVAIVYDGSTIERYIDGVAQSSTACSNTYIGYTGMGCWLMAWNHASVTREFDGKIADAMVFNTAKTSGEITDLYNNGRSGSYIYPYTCNADAVINGTNWNTTNYLNLHSSNTQSAYSVNANKDDDNEEQDWRFNNEANPMVTEDLTVIINHKSSASGVTDDARFRVEYDPGQYTAWTDLDINSASYGEDTFDFTINGPVTMLTLHVEAPGTIGTGSAFEIQKAQIIQSESTGGVEGTLNVTLDAITSSSDAESTIEASADNTLADITLDAIGEGPAAEAVAASTLDDITVSADGSVTAQAFVDSSLSDITVSALAEAPIDGSLSETLGDITVGSFGIGASRGYVDLTLSLITLSATGSDTGAIIVDSTLDDISVVSLAESTVQATLNINLESVYLTEEPLANASVDITLDDIILGSAPPSTFKIRGLHPRRLHPFKLHPVLR